MPAASMSKPPLLCRRTKTFKTAVDVFRFWCSFFHSNKLLTNEDFAVHSDVHDNYLLFRRRLLECAVASLPKSRKMNVLHFRWAVSLDWKCGEKIENGGKTQHKSRRRWDEQWRKIIGGRILKKKKKDLWTVRWENTIGHRYLSCSQCNKLWDFFFLPSLQTWKMKPPRDKLHRFEHSGWTGPAPPRGRRAHSQCRLISRKSDAMWVTAATFRDINRPRGPLRTAGTFSTLHVVMCCSAAVEFLEEHPKSFCLSLSSRTSSAPWQIRRYAQNCADAILSICNLSFSDFIARWQMTDGCFHFQTSLWTFTSSLQTTRTLCGWDALTSRQRCIKYF